MSELAVRKKNKNPTLRMWGKSIPATLLGVAAVVFCPSSLVLVACTFSLVFLLSLFFWPFGPVSKVLIVACLRQSVGRNCYKNVQQTTASLIVCIGTEWLSLAQVGRLRQLRWLPMQYH